MGDCFRIFHWLGGVCTADQLDGGSRTAWCNDWFWYWCFINDVNCSKLWLFNKKLSCFWGRICLFIYKYGQGSCFYLWVVFNARLHMYCRFKRIRFCLDV